MAISFKYFKNRMLNLEKLKGIMSIYHNYDDDKLIYLINSSTTIAESYLGISIKPKQYTTKFNGVHKVLQLPFSPLIKVEKIEIFRYSGTNESYEVKYFSIDESGEVKVLDLVYGKFMVVKYISGYEKLEENIENLLIELIRYEYESQNIIEHNKLYEIMKKYSYLKKFNIG